MRALPAPFRLFAPVSVLLLAACSGLSPRVVADMPSTTYSHLEFVSVASHRELLTDIRGNPFAVDQQQFDQAVTAAMQGQHFGPPVTFTSHPGPKTQTAYHVVMVFNPSARTNSTNLCAYAAPPETGPAKQILVQAAFCNGSGTQTSATGWLDNPTSPDSPAFRQLIADLTQNLFPLRNPNNDDNCQTFHFPGGC